MDTVSSVGKAWGGMEPGRGRQRRNMGHICNIKFLRGRFGAGVLGTMLLRATPSGQALPGSAASTAGTVYSIPTSSRPASRYSNFTLLSLTFSGEVNNLRPRAVKTSTFAYHY